MGGRQADQLREVQNEITFYLQLFPLVSFVDTTRTWERILNRDRPLCTEVWIFDIVMFQNSVPATCSDPKKFKVAVLV